MRACTQIGALTAGLFLILGCASSRVIDAVSEPRPHSVVVLRTGAGVLAGATVTLVRADGSRVLLGRSNELGRLELDLWSHSAGSGFLLVCADGYYCGALELSREVLESYREHPIALAPVVFL